MGRNKQSMFHALSDAELRQEMERRFNASYDEILVEVKERLASGALTVEDLVKLTIERSYWRGAVDATEVEVTAETPVAVEPEKPAQEAS